MSPAAATTGGGPGGGGGGGGAGGAGENDTAPPRTVKRSRRATPRPRSVSVWGRAGRRGTRIASPTRRRRLARAEPAAAPPTRATTRVRGLTPAPRTRTRLPTAA